MTVSNYQGKYVHALWIRVANEHKQMNTSASKIMNYPLNVYLPDKILANICDENANWYTICSVYEAN